METEQVQAQNDSFDDVTSKQWLKAEDLSEKVEKFACTGWEKKVQEDKTLQLILKLSRDEGKELFHFGCNKTNANFLFEADGIEKPSDVVGKVIVLSKTKAPNPKTGKQVDALRISAVAEK